MASIVVALMSLVVCVAASNKPCSMSDDVCEFWFEIKHKITMINDGKALYPKGGQLYNYDVLNTSAADPVPYLNVASADGWENPRLLIAVNDQFPGPSMEVYEGQTVVVHVTNSLPSDSITIHWHGLPQVGTPWMDGVSFITQCPIMSGQKFTYRFKATPTGTYWYHTHIGVLRSMGPYGPLIIREKKPLRIKEFVFTVTEWNHDWDSSLSQNKEEDGMFVARKEIMKSQSLDGALFSLFHVQSTLINGRGRYYYENGSHNEAPLEMFKVTKGDQYIFRVIGVGVQVPYRISVDNHSITIIASDGHDLKPTEAESFVINPGERYDFKLTADQNVDNYWIRAVTLEANLNNFGLAILRYDGAAEIDPTSQRMSCSSSNPCTVINCPFLFYPEGSNTRCITFDQLKSLKDDPAPTGSITRKQEVFLNFAFPGVDWKPGSVNGRTFKKPAVSALTQPNEIDARCKDDCGDEKICACPYSLDLQHGKIYQMVFLNMGNGKGFSHPIHMHGYSFYVLKMGYGRYNITNGKIIGDNLDINCGGGTSRDQSFCNGATWSNTSWSGDNIPGLELKNPPRKDTIIVPTGGYVVVRIRADNPGVWFMHCHIELHNMDGMALLLNNSFDKIPSPPKGFPKCGNFEYKTTGDEQVHELPIDVVDKEEISKDDDKLSTMKETSDLDKLKDNSLFWAITGSLMALSVIQLLLLVWTCRHASFSAKSVKLNSMELK